MRDETKIGLANIMVAVILMIFGTTVKSYIFEVVAICLIIFGIFIIKWDVIFKGNKKKKEMNRWTDS